MSARRTNFYLDKQNKRFMGVCSGVADYFGWDVTWVRIAAVVLTVSGIIGFLPLVYLATAWIANPKPLALYAESPEQSQVWTQVRVAPPRTSREVRSSFRDVDRRLRDVEAYMTSSNARLSNEIDQLR
ncbi:MAG: envelope stress response membrane protein PspC [Polymorphobacter sp.]